VILATVKSKNGILIRLTDERWNHIFLYHKEFKSGDYKKICLVIKAPDVIFGGNNKELLAAKRHRKSRWRVVVYREDKTDGFIITAYLTSDTTWLFKRKIIWSKK